MTFELSQLPFAQDALAPYISEETLRYHHGGHHKAYVDNLNKLIVDTKYENKSLIDIIKTSDGAIFNNAAQAWNHTFYWECLGAGKNVSISDQLMVKFDESFGSLDKFKENFTKAALSLFGSGWVWLVKNKENSLLILQTSNAKNPLTDGYQPLLTCDVWEHAYYIDYRNVRQKYIEAFWHIVNWEFVNQQFAKND